MCVDVLNAGAQVSKQRSQSWQLMCGAELQRSNLHQRRLPRTGLPTPTRMLTKGHRVLLGSTSFD